MKPINTIIVDDEFEAREGIKILLEGDDEIEVLGLCKNGVDAIDMINEHQVDLMFLDIQMPVINGFEVVNSLAKVRIPHIIFVTAYDQFALKAFEIHAIDYILKPFTNARFAEGLARAKQLIMQKELMSEQEKFRALAEELTQYDNNQDQIIISADKHKGQDKQRLIVREKGRIIFIPLSDILWLEAFDYYVKIHVKNQFHLIRESMKTLESRLPSTRFMRIHKSSIVNQAYIQQIETASNSDYKVILTDNTELKVSRSYKEVIKNITG